VNGSTKIMRFILIDFNCSNEYTHQWSSIAAYCSLLSRYKSDVEVWLPKGASKNIIERLSDNARVGCFLRSPQYYNAKFLTDPIGYLVGKLVQLVFKKKSRLSQNKGIRNTVTNFYLKDLLKKINQINPEENTTIVFPTLDYLGLETVRRIVLELPEIKVYIRRMGLEARHPLAKGDEFQLLQELVNENENLNVTLGIPTEALFHATRAKSKFPEMVTWSPLPPAPRARSLQFNDHTNRIINIGFPGTAKSSKGYDSIPDIAIKLKSEKINFRFIVQQANFEWATYQSSRMRIRELIGEDFLEYDRVLSIEHYENLFDLYDVIFLPYKVEEYANADSGILYEAANWGIPVICSNGLGFSTEAFEYGIGLDPNSFDSFSELFEFMKGKELSSKIFEYNNAREAAVVNALGLLRDARD